MNPVGVADLVAAPSQAYEHHRLHPELVEQLVSIYRTMFPHSTVPDEFYEHVVRKLDDEAAQNQALSGFLSDGVEALNGQAGSAWTDLSEEARLQALKLVEQTPFFQRLRSDFVLYFYSNPAIWPLFGYEGPSNDKGGYLHRGLIIGSGAGGGTLGNELAQKGIRTLILEAGPRTEREQHVDDERQAFAQLTWLDK
jgi:hypothetical protein